MVFKEKPWQIKLAILIRKILFSFYEKLNLVKKDTISLKEIKNILIIRTDRLGDAVVTTPLIKAIKECFPDKKLYVLCSKQNEIIFKQNPYIDEVFSIDVSPWLNYACVKIPVLGPIFNCIYSLLYHFGDKEFISAFKLLKSKNIDVVFDAVGRRRTAIIARYLGKFTTGPKLSEVIFLYNYFSDSIWVDNTSQKHIIERYFDTFFKAIKP